MKKMILLSSLLVSSFAFSKSFLDEVQDIVDVEPQVSINLGAGLIRTALAFADDKDAKEAKNLLNNLSKIQVTVYELDRNTDVDGLSELIEDKVASLSKKGYEKIVSVRDGSEKVNILAKVENQFLHDAMVVVMDGDDELVIISLDGSLNLEQLAQISDNFDVDLNLDNLVN